MNSCFIESWNGRCSRLEDVPLADWKVVRAETIQRASLGWRACSFFALRSESTGALELQLVLAHDQIGQLAIARAVVPGTEFESLAAELPQFQLFEREILEQAGLVPVNHPWMKPVRFGKPFLADAESVPQLSQPIIGEMPYYRVAGEEVHEVAVGPVHAGVIEPGHFRFQCHGEEVFHLEISLGYQHRGVEESLIGGPNKLSARKMETVAGDSSIAHGLAYCQLLEALSGTVVPPRAELIRGIALELERLANHAGDLGALAGDVGFLPTMSFCGRLRGDFLNMSALLCGNRFGRSLVIPGGVRFDIDATLTEELLRRLAAARRDIMGAIKLLFDTPSVMMRFEGTGTVSQQAAAELGLVGVAARASGLERDVRSTHPLGTYQFNGIPPALLQQGDVGSRAFVRWLEMRRSIRFVRESLRHLPEGSYAEPLLPLEKQATAVTLVEGWRGEVCHTAVTDKDGRFVRYKICDPSFHNWSGLAMALRNQQISDFPLCNKSFNLSYCGFDL